MADKNLNIKLGVKGDKTAQNALKKTQTSVTSLGASALKAGAVFFGARSIISGISSVIQLAGEQEKAEKKLEVALGKRSQALLDQASALQQVTTFGDEAILGVQASLAAFLDSEEQIKEATTATLDLSVAMGMDLKSAGDLVAKTLGSSTNAMSRYGIEVNGAVGSSERLESLTRNVANLFGGQAKAQAETMAGAIEQMGNAVGDAGEAIGELLAPVVISVAKAFKTASEVVGSFFQRLSPPDYDDIINNLKSVNAEVSLIADIQKLKLTSELIEVNNELRALGKENTTIAEVGEKTTQVTEDLTFQMKAQAEMMAIGNLKTAGFKQTLIDRLQTEAKELTQIGELITRREKLNELISSIGATEKEVVETKKKNNEIDKENIEHATGNLELKQQELAFMPEFTEGFKELVESKQAQIEQQELEIRNNNLLISMYPDLAKKLGLVTDKTDLATKAWKTFKKNVDVATASSIQAGASITSTSDALYASGEAAKSVAIDSVTSSIMISVAEWMKSFMAKTPLHPMIAGPLALAGGAAFGSLMGSAIQRMKFEDGGIVPGTDTGQGDTVPAMLTPGEIILNKAQQQNLTNGMGVTVNISGNVLGTEEFVRDVLIPEIQNGIKLA